jgi:GT2 family glycosyltransferase
VKVSAVVPTYNSGELLDRCLDALAATDVVDDVTVLDGGSSDDTGERAAGRPGVRVVRLEGTKLSHRLNKGVEEAKHGIVLLLNDDAFVDPETPARLASVLLERPQVGVVGARLRYEDGSEQRSAGRYKTLLTSVLVVVGLNRLAIRLRAPDVRPEPGTGLAVTTWLPLCAAAVRKDAFRAIGGFDERFSFYSEDQDFARRLTEAGWQTVVRNDAGAVHLGGGATKAKDAGHWYVQYHQNRFIYLQKHYPRAWRVYGVLWALRASLHIAVWQARAIVYRLRSDAEGERSARKWVAAFRQARIPARAGDSDQR